MSPEIQLLEQHSEITSQSERQGRERKPDYLCFVWNCKQHTAIVETNNTLKYKKQPSLCNNKFKRLVEAKQFDAEERTLV